MSPELLKRTDDAISQLRNGTGDDDGDPYVSDTPERMEARHEDYKAKTGHAPDWCDYGIRVRVADDCELCTVHGFEGQAMWGTAHAIAGAGKLIHDLKAALLAAEAEAAAGVDL